MAASASPINCLDFFLQYCDVTLKGRQTDRDIRNARVVIQQTQQKHDATWALPWRGTRTNYRRQISDLKTRITTLREEQAKRENQYMSVLQNVQTNDRI